MKNLNWKLIGIVAVVVVIVGLGAWLLFFRGSAPATSNSTGTFGSAGNTTESTGVTATQNLSQAGAQSATTQVFEIDPGPVAGATFIETLNPTTTIARYVLADNGHVMDLPVDSPGAVAQPVSNTTIPGIQNVLWTDQGQGALMQYLDTD